MYGTLRGALAGRKIAFDRESYKATVEGRIVGIGKTIRIRSMHVHYDLAVEATERALAVHVQGCPAHQSVKDAIGITWDATLRAGDRTVTVREESHGASAWGLKTDRAEGGPALPGRAPVRPDRRADRSARAARRAAGAGGVL